jgi:glutamate racemase
MSKESKIYLGIIDWGIGGISIYKLIKSRLGDVPIIYFSDTGATPYGKMSRLELVTRLNSVIDFLNSQGVTQLVIGCNAASTAITFLNNKNVKIEGVIESAVNLVEKLQPKKLALIGGKRTVLSGVYRRKLAESDIKIHQRIAQPLSAIIESGDTSSTKLREEVKKIISPIKNCSHLLLACTHYPAIISVLKDFVSKETVFIDPAVELVNKISNWDLPKGGRDIFFTTGNAENMQKASLNAFNVRIDEVQQIKI